MDLEQVAAAAVVAEQRGARYRPCGALRDLDLRVQGRAGAFVLELQGSYTGVVGLPLYEMLALLQGLGWRGAA